MCAEPTCHQFRLLQKLKNSGQVQVMYEGNLNQEWEIICDQVAKRFAIEFLQKDYDFLMAGLMAAGDGR